MSGANRSAAEAGSRRPIVLAEDDAAIRQLVGETLSGQDYEVHLAANGAQALAKLRDLGRPALLVVDLRMPVMGGQELIDCLDQEADGLHRVIVATAVPNAHRAVHSASLVGVVQKPFSLFGLLDLVARHASAGPG